MLTLLLHSQQCMDSDVSGFESFRGQDTWGDMLTLLLHSQKCMDSDGKLLLCKSIVSRD